jgi:SAM-dependent methyltransferase
MKVASSGFACPVCQNPARVSPFMLGGYHLFACSCCQLHFAPEAFAVSVDYDDVYQSDEYKNEQIRSLHERFDPEEWSRHPTYNPFFHQVPQDPGATLLDVGCGVGRFCHAAVLHGWDVTGLDISSRALEIGRRHATFPMLEGTLESLIQNGMRFNALTAFEVLEHLTAPIAFLRQVRQVLHPGGTVFMTVPNWASPVMQETDLPCLVPPIHICFYLAETLRVALDRAGFSEVKVGGIWMERPSRGFLSDFKWLGRRLRGRLPPPLGLWARARHDER